MIYGAGRRTVNGTRLNPWRNENRRNADAKPLKIEIVEFAFQIVRCNSIRGRRNMVIVSSMLVVRDQPKGCRSSLERGRSSRLSLVRTGLRGTLQTTLRTSSC